MVANLNIISLFFNQCNNMYFENELPVPEFGILHSFRTCGYFQYTEGGWFDKNIYSPTILITDYYDFTKDQLEELMCHEMIHYYLAYTGVDRRCIHGKEFVKMAKVINLKYNLNITPTVDVSKYERRKGTSRFLYWLETLI